MRAVAAVETSLEAAENEDTVEVHPPPIWENVRFSNPEDRMEFKECLANLSRRKKKKNLSRWTDGLETLHDMEVEDAHEGESPDPEFYPYSTRCSRPQSSPLQFQKDFQKKHHPFGHWEKKLQPQTNYVGPQFLSPQFEAPRDRGASPFDAQSQHHQLNSDSGPGPQYPEVKRAFFPSPMSSSFTTRYSIGNKQP